MVHLPGPPALFGPRRRDICGRLAARGGRRGGASAIYFLEIVFASFETIEFSKNGPEIFAGSLSGGVYAVL